MEIKVSRKQEENMYGIFPGVGLLLSPFAKIAIVALLVALLSSGVFSVFKVLEVKNLEMDNLKKDVAIERLTGEVSACQTALEDQNGEIARIRADAEQDLIAVTMINEKLADLTKVQSREISILRNRPAPENCDDSKEYLKENLDTFEAPKQ